MKIEFIAAGKAEPQGSGKVVSLPGRKYSVIVSDNPKLRRWRQIVRRAAEAAMRSENFEQIQREIPVIAQLQFCFRRPKSAKDRRFPTVRPDVDKLVRGVFDALTGVVWADDAQVVRVTTAKHYGDFERVEIRVEAA